MTQRADPRGTFLKIGDSVKRQIDDDPDMTELPSLAEVMRDHKVSRGVALRAFGMLRQEGVAVPAPGERTRESIGARSNSRSRTSSRLTGSKWGSHFPVLPRWPNGSESHVPL
ncbi:hypothetical protein ACPCK2_30560 [Streptomyces pseudogriseolus]|uniref:hypothetical protein n=1 Tax=Streptomyces pseudogriseolus TaxID=36817 RepID=UPI003FA321DE